ncbi:MAG: DUF3842 family protein [Defluviitaleaceae bacterium]|nr:DUF3842 family protein [Defluviitaleaceae bacterium]MCL2240574.1 DUF3842 family protein [Defluviitaleaceae bacterium]
MKILVIDGMGGGIGRAIIEKIKAEVKGAEVMAVGTNAIATTAMLKAGADHGATGENAVIYNAANTDYIMGVLGIAFANAMHGEISPKMAEALSQSRAHKILIPTDKCSVTVAGVAAASMQEYIHDAVGKLARFS